jgi:SAM-dependent methyltransferase
MGTMGAAATGAETTDPGRGGDADPAYAMGRTAHETGRLHRQGQLYGPLTRRLLEAAGIGPGLRVLDVGSGAGDVALLLADLVGPTGAVVGVDPNAEILAVARQRVAALGWTNVAFVEGDVRTAALPGPFDAAVGRFVLIWVREPVDVLRACARLVRPGGLVVFQEHDLQGFYRAYPPSPLLERLQRLGMAFVERQGLDPWTAYRLHGAFEAAGLPRPQLREEAPLGGGPEWVGYETFADHYRSGEPFLVAAGVATREELGVDTLAERLRAEVVGQRGVLRCVPAVGAWARVPAPAGAA